MGSNHLSSACHTDAFPISYRPNEEMENRGGIEPLSHRVRAGCGPQSSSWRTVHCLGGAYRNLTDQARILQGFSGYIAHAPCGGRSSANRTRSITPCHGVAFPSGSRPIERLVVGVVSQSPKTPATLISRILSTNKNHASYGMSRRNKLHLIQQATTLSIV